MDGSGAAQKVSEILLTFRRLRGYTIEYVAASTGLPKSSISEWERGLHVPSPDKLNLLLDTFEAGPRRRAQLATILDDPAVWKALKLPAQAHPSSFLGDAILGLRLRRGLGQVELASKMGISQGTISSWESGRKRPTDEYFASLTQALTLRPGESEVLQRMDSKSASLVDQVMSMRSPIEAEELFTEVKDLEENVGALRALTLFHVIRSRWLIDNRWLPLVIRSGDRYADILMSAHRNRELLRFTTTLIDEIQPEYRQGIHYENLRIMKLIGAARLAMPKGLPWIELSRFRMEAETFQFVKPWAISTLCQVAVLCKQPAACEELLNVYGTFVSSQPEKIEIDAQFHLISNLHCDIDRPKAALEILESHWSAYWKWANPNAPYMLTAFRTASRAYRKVGDFSSAEAMASEGHRRLSQMSPEGKEGAYANVQKILNEELELVESRAIA